MVDDDDTRKAGGTVEEWLSKIAKAQKMGSWQGRCANIRRLYRDDQSQNRRKRKYAMLWSNMETMRPAVYSRSPKAVVQRRFKDSDKVGRLATEVLERAINFTFDARDYTTRLEQVRDDYLLYGRGVARVEYKPVFSTVEAPDEVEGPDTEAVEGPRAETLELGDFDERGKQKRQGSVDGVGGAAEPQGDQETLDFETVELRFVQRQDFVHDQSRTWDECGWEAFRAYLSRAGCIKRFGEEVGGAIPIGGDESQDDAGKRPEDKAEIWEIWDKDNRRVLWVCKGMDKPLEEGPPYLKLEGFWPNPRPAYGTLTTDSLEPVPDFVYYQDQVEEIDRLTARIAALTDALKLVGFYPAGPQGEGAPEIERAMTPGFENKMIAVKSWAIFQQGGDKGAPIVWLPVEEVGAILKGCVELRKQLIDDVYQIYGLSDIMRGDGDPGETAAAQNIKSQYGSVRIKSRQGEMARFCRDLSQIVGEIIAGQFQPETLAKMVNINLPSQADVQQAQAQANWQAQQENQQNAVQYQQAVIQSQQQENQQQTAAPGPGGIASPVAVPAGAGAPGPGGPGGPPQGSSGASVPGQGGPPVPPPPQPVQPPDVAAQMGPTQEDVFGMLRDGVMRRFRLDIENDSTITGNETQEKQDRTDFLEAVTKFLETWGPMVQAKPDLAPLCSALLLFAVRSFRVGRELEEIIEETADKMAQAAQAPQPPPPEAAQKQAELQATQMKAQAEITKANIGVQQSQVEGQLAIQAASIKAHADEAKAAQDAQKLQNEAQRDAMKHKQSLEQMQLGMQAQAAAPKGAQ
jgi:hypothetical protein